MNWLYSSQISAFSIDENWSDLNDINSGGIINLSSNGKRSYE
jgi:hypothetical protein